MKQRIKRQNKPSEKRKPVTQNPSAPPPPVVPNIPNDKILTAPHPAAPGHGAPPRRETVPKESAPQVVSRIVASCVPTPTWRWPSSTPTWSSRAKVQVAAAC